MRKMLKSFCHALAGIRAAVCSERNMRIHIGVMCLVIAAGLFLGLSRTEWMLCILLFALVIGSELMNTAVEALVDLVSPQYHILAKRAKDVAAGAVLVCAIAAAIIGLMIFLPKLWSLLAV